MSGLKAATAAPTWPDINGSIVPAQINTISPWWINLTDNKIVVQFIHRTIAYLLIVIVFIWWVKAKKIKSNDLFNKTKWLPLSFILLQVILGIITVIRSPFGNSLVWLGLAHQFVAMLFLISMMWMIFLIRSHIKINSV